MSASNNYPPLNNSDYQLSTNSTNLIVGKTIICVNGMMINGTNICICDLGWTLDSKLVKLNPNATVIYDCTLYNDPKTNAGSSNNSQSNSNINSNSLNTTDANTLNAPNVNNTLQSNGNSQNSQSSTDNGNIRNNSTSSWILDSTAFSWGDLPNVN